MALNIGNQFHLLLEYWVPTILKQIPVKIQVISTSADKAMKVIMTSTSQGYAKLLPLLAENCTSSKSPTMRKHVIEFITLACSVWNNEILEK